MLHLSQKSIFPYIYIYLYKYCIYNFEFTVSAKFPVCRGAYCTIEGCIDKRSDEFVAVKIIDIPKMTITTGLTIQGTFDIPFKSIYYIVLNVILPVCAVVCSTGSISSSVCFSAYEKYLVQQNITHLQQIMVSFYQEENLVPTQDISLFHVCGSVCICRLQSF